MRNTAFIRIHRPILQLFFSLLFPFTKSYNIFSFSTRTLAHGLGAVSTQKNLRLSVLFLCICSVISAWVVAITVSNLCCLAHPPSPASAGRRTQRFQAPRFLPNSPAAARGSHPVLLPHDTLYCLKLLQQNTRSVNDDNRQFSANFCTVTPVQVTRAGGVKMQAELDLRRPVRLSKNAAAVPARRWR